MRHKGTAVGTSRLIAGGLVLVLLLTFPPFAAGVHNGDTSSTLISQLGEFRGLAVDRARARLYATDDTSFDGVKVVGLVVIDLNTHAEVTRLPFYGLTGVALSPGGSRLVVGSQDGYLRVIDPDTLSVIQAKFFYGESFTAAYMWDMAFDGEDRVVISEGSSFVTCEGRVIAVNLTSMTKIAELSEPPCGIEPFSGVSVVSGIGRLYVLQDQQVSAYYVSNFTKIFGLHDAGFTTHAEITPDGRRLVFSSGSAYDASTLGLLADVGHSGDIAIDYLGVHAYFVQGPFIDAVRLTDYSLTARFAFVSYEVFGPMTVKGIAIDKDRSVAYVLDPEAQNANTLHSVPLLPAFLDPYPADGSVVPTDFFGIRASVSGGIDPASVKVFVDQALVAHGDDPGYGFIGYLPSSPWPQGVHHVAVWGAISSGGSTWLNWSFTIDSVPPEIVIEDPPPAYRTPDAIVRGRIIDTTAVEASANEMPLAVDRATGEFSATVRLEEGANAFSIYARDQAYNENRSFTLLLYVPTTTRYVDADAAFSLEFPSNWSLQKDVTVQDVKLEAVMTGSFGVNLNVISITGILNPSQAGINAEAERAYASVSQLPGFSSFEEPAPIEIPSLVAATYSYAWDATGGRVYQRQVLASDPVARHAWILTFTAGEEVAFRYDLMFLWMADSLRPERGVPAPASVPLVVIVGGAIVALAAVLGVGLILLRRNRTKASPPPVQWPPVAGAPEVPPHKIREPPRPPPGT